MASPFWCVYVCVCSMRERKREGLDCFSLLDFVVVVVCVVVVGVVVVFQDLMTASAASLPTKLLRGHWCRGVLSGQTLCDRSCLLIGEEQGVHLSTSET